MEEKLQMIRLFFFFEYAAQKESCMISDVDTFPTLCTVRVKWGYCSSDILNMSCHPKNWVTLSIKGWSEGQPARCFHLLPCTCVRVCTAWVYLTQSTSFSGVFRVGSVPRADSLHEGKARPGMARHGKVAGVAQGCAVSELQTNMTKSSPES